MNSLERFRNTIPVMKLLILLASVLVTASATAALPPDIQTKVDKYKKSITEWAANPVVVDAVKEANKSGPIRGMTNVKWDELNNNDPIVLSKQSSPAGQYAKKLEGDSDVDKFTLWDEKGNMIASGTKTFVYNAASRPAFVNAMKGLVWSAPEVKTDPTTLKKSVNISAPVMEGGKIIGVVNAAIKAE